MLHSQISLFCPARTLHGYDQDSQTRHIESRRDLVRLTIVHRPHRPYHKMELNDTETLDSSNRTR